MEQQSEAPYKVEATYAPVMGSYTARSESQITNIQTYMSSNHFPFTVPVGARGYGGKANYSTPGVPVSEHGFVMLWRKQP